MKEYRKALKDHFEAIPWMKSLIGIDFVFYGVGLLLLVLTACLSMSASATLMDLLNGIGMISFLFGLFLAFVKKDDLGIMISAGVYA